MNEGFVNLLSICKQIYLEIRHKSFTARIQWVILYHYNTRDNELYVSQKVLRHFWEQVSYSGLIVTYGLISVSRSIVYLYLSLGNFSWNRMKCQRLRTLFLFIVNSKYVSFQHIHFSCFRVKEREAGRWKWVSDRK